VSPKTVETYRARIKEKLGLANITGLIQRATQWVLENG
jgi:DNA-binding CsgD family transcriptional regulator